MQKNNRFIDSPEVLNFVGHEAITSPAYVTKDTYVRPVDTDQLNGEQSLTYTVSEYGTPKSLIIMPPAWSDYADRPFQMLRSGAMARFAESRVVSLSVPGMGEGNDLLTEKQSEQLKDGRMTDVTDGYWELITTKELHKDSTGNNLPIVLFGNSLSTLTVSEMAASMPEHLTIRDLMLSESMALEKTSLGKLALKFISKGGTDLSKYQGMNEGMPEAELGSMVTLAKQVAKQPGAHWSAVMALSRGQQPNLIKSAIQDGRIKDDLEHGTRIHVVNAGEGLVDPSASYRFTRDLSKNRFKNGQLLHTKTLTGEYHGYQDSLPALLAVMSRLSIINS